MTTPETTPADGKRDDGLFERALAVNEVLQSLVFANGPLMVMVRQRLELFGPRGDERGFWAMVGDVACMEQGSNWLKQRAGEHVLTSHDVERCLKRMRVNVTWVGPEHWQPRRKEPAFERLVAAVETYQPATNVLLQLVIETMDAATHERRTVAQQVTSYSMTKVNDCLRRVRTNGLPAEAKAGNPLATHIIDALLAVPELVIQDGDDNIQGIRMPDMSAYRCQSCGNAATARYICTVCRSVRYCGKACQCQDWNAHKDMCSALALHESILAVAAALDQVKEDGA